jgi:hypothetical protein
LCIGACGQKCPSVCRICDPQNECFETFFGYEEDTDSLFYELSCKHIFELRALDKYIFESKSIQMPTCPKCKKPLSNEKRYSNQLKETYASIQNVKLVYLKRCGDYENYHLNGCKKIEAIKLHYSKITNTPITYSLFSLFQNLNPKDNFILSSAYNIILLCEKFLLIESFYNMNVQSSPENKILFEKFKDNCDIIVKYFQSFKCYSNDFFENLQIKIDSLYVYVQLSFKSFPGVENILLRLQKSNFKLDKEEMQIILKQFPSIEKQQLIRILNVVAGTWYLCPNGHVYSVGECGRPMQEGRCPECNARIGGRNHIPNQGNTLMNHDDPDNIEII